MKLRFLGTGTSQGIPVLGSEHPVSHSLDFRDKRLRTSALITTEEDKKILIDCGPDFRQQMLNNQESHVDAVLLTHEHNDHVIGLDDLRPIIHRNKANTPLYCSDRTAKEIKNRFPYAFSEFRYPGAPSFDLHLIDNEFEILNTQITPIEVMHGNLPIFGFKCKNLVYITDASYIERHIQEKHLMNLDVLIINCLRKENEHPTHYILPQIIDLVDELKPKTTYLTHISQNLGFHEEVEKELPANIRLGYDGLEIYF